MQRRHFLGQSARAGFALGLLGLHACKSDSKKTDNSDQESSTAGAEDEVLFQWSLAQWSINRMIREDGLDPYAFAEKAAAWGFTGLEYVSGLYYPELEKSNFSAEAMEAFVSKSLAESEKHGLQNLLIMVDGQGDLAAADATERAEAVTNHHKWVDAANAMGCHSIRVNLNGVQEEVPWKEASVDGLKALCTYAATKNINVLVENHGGLSSKASLLAEVMQEVGMDNCGTLPDFGNFCVRREAGDYYESPCIEEYDIYQGIEELMPYAKAVSAKSYDFDAEGKETKIDFFRVMEIVKSAGYSGFVGVEYEGGRLSEEEGIIATKKLLISAAENLKA